VLAIIGKGIFSTVCRPRVAVSGGFAGAESWETDRSIGCNGRRPHGSQGDYAVPHPAKRSSGNHDPSRGLGPPQPIFALAHPMQSSACVRPLVTSIGRAELLPPGSSSTPLAAVALPTVAMAADAEDDATPTTVTVAEHNRRTWISLVPITLHRTTDDARLRRR
jgi:hypothetical protein